MIDDVCSSLVSVEVTATSGANPSTDLLAATSVANRTSGRSINAGTGPGLARDLHFTALLLSKLSL